ncbi:MAG: glycosyltransferase family 2 protein [Paracoccaceae bacterium]
MNAFVMEPGARRGLTREKSCEIGPLIVIPCLNEVHHIGGLLLQLVKAQQSIGGKIVVVDGGSTDGTQVAVGQIAANTDAVILLDNPQKLQSSAVNLAVDRYGDNTNYLIRIDAHASYPEDYCQILLKEVKAQQADSIVVSMTAAGNPGFQKINAAAQNSSVGNGGARHRNQSSGQFVEHGHHALMSIAAFQAVGGYDTGFSHNEDAELDYRLGKAGYRIWLTCKTQVTYYPRSSFSALAKQYYNFGKGRAKNNLKHRILPNKRQAIVTFVAPAVLLAFLTVFHWIFAVPALVWAGYCAVSGVKLAIKEREFSLVGTGVAAMLMHLAWSLGFWRNILFGFTGRQQGSTP